MKMKLLLPLLAAVLLASLSRAAGLNPVAFRITSQQFASGDSITIQEVIASSPDLKVGDTVVVRGTYRLASQPGGTLGFFLTSSGPSAPTPVAPQQRQKIAAGSGTFELKHVVPAAGSLHVSFYPGARGSSFGGVYFAPSRP